MKTIRKLTVLVIGVAVAALLVAVAGNLGPAQGAIVPPQGFTQTQVTSGLIGNHDMEFVAC